MSRGAASVLPLLLSAAASLALTSLVIRGAKARRLYDMPTGGRHIHTRPVPRLGGIAVFASLVLGVLAYAVVEMLGGGRVDGRFLTGILLGGGLVFAVGLRDDLRGVRPVAKLAAQGIAASIAFACGFRIEVIRLAPELHIALGGLALPVTVLWVMLLSNAFNLIDGMDGLAGGIALLALGATALVSMVDHNVELVPICLALIGALLGFMRYNVHPARIFLGDSGSLFVGFLLPILAVRGVYTAQGAVVTVVPLFLLAIPLLDTSLAVARRWLRGTPVFGADRRHLHHQLLAHGFTAWQAVSLLYLGAIVLALPGIWLASGTPRWTYVIAAGALYGTGLVYGTCRLGYHEFTVATGVLASGLGRARRTIRASIHARDVAQLIERAESLEHVEAILCDSASALGLRGVEIRRVTPQAGRRASAGPVPPNVWQVEYLLEPSASRGARTTEREGGCVLRLWGDRLDQLGAYDLNRAMTSIVPAIEEYMARSRHAPVSPAAEGGARGAPRAMGAMR